MPMYEACRRYQSGGRDDGVRFVAGWLYHLSEDQAALVERDSAGTLRQLTDAEIDRLQAALDDAKKASGFPIRVDWSPHRPVHPSKLDKVVNGYTGEVVA